MSWEGDLQFTRVDEQICIKSTLNFISIDDEDNHTTLQVDNKGAYIFAKNKKVVSSIYIKLDASNNKAILNINGNESYEFIIKKDKNKLKAYHLCNGSSFSGLRDLSR